MALFHLWILLCLNPEQKRRGRICGIKDQTWESNLEDGLQQVAKTRDFPSFPCSGAFKIGARRTSISNRADMSHNRSGMGICFHVVA